MGKGITMVNSVSSVASGVNNNYAANTIYIPKAEREKTWAEMQNGNPQFFTQPTNKTVTIGDQVYPVVKVLDTSHPERMSMLPIYKEVVIVDGKQYDVQNVRDNIAFDKNKQVVVIDGQEYDVNANNSGWDENPRFIAIA